MCFCTVSAVVSLVSIACVEQSSISQTESSLVSSVLPPPSSKKENSLDWKLVKQLGNALLVSCRHAVGGRRAVDRGNYAFRLLVTATCVCVSCRHAAGDGRAAHRGESQRTYRNYTGGGGFNREAVLPYDLLLGTYHWSRRVHENFHLLCYNLFLLQL